MTGPLRVRPAREDEWRALRELRLRSLREDESAFGHTYALALSRSDADWRAYAAVTQRRQSFVAEAGGALVGMARAELRPEPSGSPLLPLAPSETRAADLYAMWVAPEARGRGAGRALVEAVLAWSRELGARRIDLWVAEARAPARALYERCGFVATGKRAPIESKPEVIAIEMTRGL